MSFSEQEIQAVWEKGFRAGSYDPNYVRQDACAALMERVRHGDRHSRYGWEIDHIDPKGGDNIENLQPLQWENNVDKSDGQLKCAVRAIGNTNYATDT